mgnify:FL=1
MKMKRLRNLLILFIMVICIGITKVNAAELAVGQKYDKSWISGLTNGRDNLGNNKILAYGVSIDNSVISRLSVIPYEISGNNNKMLGYCIDPHLQSTNPYKVDYILGASKDKKTNAIGLGVLEIMKYGYSRIEGAPTISTSLNNSEFYVATSIAVRAFALGVGDQGKGSATNSELKAIASAHVKAGIDWLNETEYKSVFSSSTKYSWYDEKYSFNFKSENNGKEIERVAKELFNIGLAKAAESLKGDATTATIEKSAISNKNNVYSVTLNYKNFDASKGEIKNFKLVCANCAQNGISIGTLKVNEENVNFNKNYLSGSNGKIDLSFEATMNSEICKKAEFKITYEFNDPSLEFVGAHLIPGTTNSQNFYVIEKNDGGLKDEITGKIDTCKNNACKTELQTPICSENEDDAIAVIKGPDKIKTCVLDNEDDAGNTYQFTPAAGGVSNDYCNVFCKEDYAQIKMNPIIKDVKCGGYFKLTSHIEGTKTCYTSGNKTDKSIDKEKFEKDIKEAVAKMVDAYNIYSFYAAAASTSYTHERSSDSHVACSGGEEGCPTCKPPKEDTRWSCGSVSKSVDLVSKTWTFGYYDTNGKYYANQTKYTTRSGETLVADYSSGTAADCKCCSCSGSDGKEVDHKSLRDSALKTLNSAIKEYQRILTDYNNCTTGWTTDFLFKQKLRYYYDENHGKNGSNYTPYYDLIATDEYKEKQYLTPDGNPEVKTTISVCTGNTDNYYNCVSGNSYVSLSEDELKHSGAFKAVAYTVCDTTGCKVVNESVSQARFVKKEVEKKQDYITPTAFYQIAANGKITVNGDYTGNKVQLEALLNGLPVSTNTVGGGVFRLMIEDLGEFYDEKEGTGRLIDFNGDREENSVAYNNGANTFDGNYTCRYESPCKPKDCPNCTFECIGDSCEWKQCTGDSCEVACNGCIINLDELNIIHKTISTTNFHAANRTFGYNWITTSNLESLKLLNKKAEKTITEIEDVNEMVYDDKTGDDSELAFSIKMTPDVINTIKEYNKKHTKDGGYINDSLTCYDATIDGKTYKNIYCYSDLIDELVGEYEEVIKAPNRLENNESKRKSETESSGYWTLWSGYVYNESVLGGPSWK